MSKTSIIGDAVEAAINAAKSGYNLEPNVQLVFFPEDLEGAIPLTCYVVPLQYDEVIETRASIKAIMPVMIGIVKSPIVPTKYADVAALVTLTEQVRKTLRSVTAVIGDRNFGWQDTIAVKDETGVPFSYVKMREQHTFEAYFTANYHIITKD
jgi:hypothetical protein